MEVNKSMASCRDRGTASGKQVGKGSDGWLARRGTAASVIDGVI